VTVTDQAGSPREARLGIRRDHDHKRRSVPSGACDRGPVVFPVPARSGPATPSASVISASSVAPCWDRHC